LRGPELRVGVELVSPSTHGWCDGWVVGDLPGAAVRLGYP